MQSAECSLCSSYLRNCWEGTYSACTVTDMLALLPAPPRACPAGAGRAWQSLLRLYAASEENAPHASKCGSSTSTPPASSCILDDTFTMRTGCRPLLCARAHAVISA